MAKHVVLPIGSLADAQREIERLAGLLERLTGPAGGVAPIGPAGGVLSGSYPDPGFAVNMATQAELDAAIAGIPPVDLTPYRTSAAEDVINAAEAAARAAADTTLQNNINAEATARAAADTAEVTARNTAITTASTADRDRANHTNTQLAATISDFASASRAQTEAELVAGSNITITPSGSGATRQLTLASTGGGGGSGTAYGDNYSYFDPDKPPTNPHALDDEGSGTAGAAVAGFTGFTPGASTFTYDGKGRMVLLGASADGDNPRLWYKASPGGAVTITAKLTANIAAQYGHVGIAMMDSATGKMVTFGVQNRGGAAYLSRQSWNAGAPFTFSSEGFSALEEHRTIYVQMRWNSPNLTTWLSFDGIHDWIQAEGNITHLATVDRIGVDVNGWGSSNPTAVFDFWRVKQATSDVIGGLRTVGATLGAPDIWSIETPPTSPSALDDEFNSAMLNPKWAAVGALAQAVTMRDGMLELATTGAGAAFSTTGYEQVLPAGPFTVITPVRCLGGQYTIGGLHLRNATTGAMVRFGLFQNSGSATDIWMAFHRYSSLTNRTAVISDTNRGQQEWLLRISYDGTNFYFDFGKYSDEGGVYWFAHAQEAAGTTFGAGLPNRVGISNDPFATGTFKSTFRFFRYYPTSRANTGGFASSVSGTRRFWDVSAIPSDPAVLSAKTIDFADPAASIAAFTWGNQGTATAAIQRKRLYMASQSNGGASSSRRVLYPSAGLQLPATPWCIQVPVTVYAAAAFNLAGIFLKNSVAGKVYDFHLHARNDAGKPFMVGLSRGTSETVLTTDAWNDVGFPFGVLAIGFDGTTFSFWASPDGRDWLPEAHFTETAVAHLGAGGTYTYGFEVDSVAARKSGGAFNNAIILNQATPIPHGQLV